MREFRVFGQFGVLPVSAGVLDTESPSRNRGGIELALLPGPGSTYGQWKSQALPESRSTERALTDQHWITIRTSACNGMSQGDIEKRTGLLRCYLSR